MEKKLDDLWSSATRSKREPPNVDAEGFVSVLPCWFYMEFLFSGGPLEAYLMRYHNEKKAATAVSLPNSTKAKSRIKSAALTADQLLFSPPAKEASPKQTTPEREEKSSQPVPFLIRKMLDLPSASNSDEVLTEHDLYREARQFDVASDAGTYTIDSDEEAKPERPVIAESTVGIVYISGRSCLPFVPYYRSMKQKRP